MWNNWVPTGRNSFSFYSWLHVGSSTSWCVNVEFTFIIKFINRQYCLLYLCGMSNMSNAIARAEMFQLPLMTNLCPLVLANVVPRLRFLFWRVRREVSCGAFWERSRVCCLLDCRGRQTHRFTRCIWQWWTKTYI